MDVWMDVYLSSRHALNIHQEVDALTCARVLACGVDYDINGIKIKEKETLVFIVSYSVFY